MLAPRSDAYASVVRFAVPARERVLAATGALLCAAAGTACWRAWAGPTGARTGAVAAFAAISLVLAARAWWVESIDLLVDARTWRRTRGFPPLRRTDQVAFASLASLRFAVNEAHNGMNGLPEQAFDAWLDVAGKRLNLVKGWRGEGAFEHLELIGERLSAPLEPADRTAAKPVWKERAGTLGICAGILGIFCVMFWPVLSGKRPIRAAWASPFIENASNYSRPQAAFFNARAKFDEGKFEEAERLFHDAMEVGADRAECFNMIAYSQAGQKQFDQALETARKALSYEPESGRIIDTVGEMHELRGEYELAVKYYLEALLKPDLGEPAVETNTKLGRSLLALGRRDEAIVRLKEAARFPQAQYGSQAVRILRQLREPVPMPMGYGSPRPRMMIR